MTGQAIDLEAFRARDVARKRRSPRRSLGWKRFIAGPLPLEWVAAAGRLPGASLQVAMGLLYLRGLTKSDTVKVPKQVADLFGVSRHSEARALRAMAAAGLVRVEAHRGRRPRVTLLLPET